MWRKYLCSLKAALTPAVTLHPSPPKQCQMPPPLHCGNGSVLKSVRWEHVPLILSTKYSWLGVRSKYCTIAFRVGMSGALTSAACFRLLMLASATNEEAAQSAATTPARRAASLQRALLFGTPLEVLETFKHPHSPKRSFQFQWSSRHLLYITERKSYKEPTSTFKSRGRVTKRGWDRHWSVFLQASQRTQLLRRCYTISLKKVDLIQTQHLKSTSWLGGI